MAAIHHQPGRQLLGRQAAGRRCDRLAVVVAALLAAPQHQMAIGVAGGGYDRRHALLVDAQEMMGSGRRLHGMNGRAHAAVGAVFEADRHRQAGGHLPVGLAFGGAGADRRPADQIGDVLGHDRIQQLRGRRQAHLGQVQQQFPGEAQTRIDVVAAIEMGVVDQPLPAHGGAGLLEIHPHHQLQLLAVALSDAGDGGGVFPGGGHVMHRAGPNDHQQALILAVQDRLDPLPGLLHGVGGRRGERQLAVEHGGAHQGPGFHHVEVGGGEHGQSQLARGQITSLEGPGRQDLTIGAQKQQQFQANHRDQGCVDPAAGLLPQGHL